MVKKTSSDQGQKDQLLKLIEKINSAGLPEDLKETAAEEVERLKLSQGTDWFWQGLRRLSEWNDWIISLPWSKKSDDILSLDHAREVLDKSHYGLNQLKQRILEYLSVMILQEQRGMELIQAPVLCFIGLVGTGKTTIAKSIADALGRKFIRIPFGGLGDPLYLRGQSRLHTEADPGQLIKGLRQAGTNNPVILLDEIDRVADDALQTIMGVLVELLDPEQNSRFTDHYIGYPFDLSKAVFIATGNNTRRIATAVLDRLEVMQMPSYSDEEKLTIGRSYLLPRAVEKSGLKSGELAIDEKCWQQIVRPLGYDAGVRTLNRTIEAICRKAAMEIVEGGREKITITLENVKNYLPQW